MHKNLQSSIINFRKYSHEDPTKIRTIDEERKISRKTENRIAKKNSGGEKGLGSIFTFAWSRLIAIDGKIKATSNARLRPRLEILTKRSATTLLRV